MTRYFSRQIEPLLLDNLNRDEIIVLYGVRQAGKTTLLRRIRQILDASKQVCHFINLDNPKYMLKVNEDPANIFEITGPGNGNRMVVMIDEFQYLQNPLSFLKYVYDEYKGKVKLIVSGSPACHLDFTNQENMAGRLRLLELRLLNFREFLHFRQRDELVNALGEVPGLQKKEIPLVLQEKLKPLYLEYIRYGAYPGVVLEESETDKIHLLETIANAYLSKDMEGEGVRHKKQYRSLITILAERTGSLLNHSELASMLGISITAVENYLNRLERSFLIRRLEPFYDKLTKEIRKMTRFYFVDLGLRNAILNNFSPLDDRLDREQYFKNVICKLCLDHPATRSLQFWRTQSKHELDFVINRQAALEARFSSKSGRTKKYDLFRETYPEIPLQIICQKDIVDNHMSVYDLL